MTRSGGRQIGGPGVLSFSSFWFFSLLERLGLAPVVGIRSNNIYIYIYICVCVCYVCVFFLILSV